MHTCRYCGQDAIFVIDSKWALCRACNFISKYPYEEPPMSVSVVVDKYGPTKLLSLSNEWHFQRMLAQLRSNLNIGDELIIECPVSDREYDLSNEAVFSHHNVSIFTSFHLKQMIEVNCLKLKNLKLDKWTCIIEATKV